MNHYGWQDCPSATRRQTQHITDAVQARLANDLVGVYLHGSLAMGCFNPARSDLDLLVVTRAPLDLAAKHDLVAMLLHYSCAPHPVEISFLQQQQLQPWRYPPPFDLHYSESWRDRYAQDLADGSWRHWNDAERVDPDLGAHLPVVRARGICLAGAPIAAVIPLIPAADYRAAILSDFADWPMHLAENSVYYVLNACRIAGYCADEHIRSKAEGAAWALDHLPETWRTLITHALAAYQGAGDAQVEIDDARAFMAAMEQRLANQ